MRVFVCTFLRGQDKFMPAVLRCLSEFNRRVLTHGMAFRQPICQAHQPTSSSPPASWPPTRCCSHLLCTALCFLDTVLASETCEELFTPHSPHIDLALAGDLRGA